jgi:hypothetical protein
MDCHGHGGTQPFAETYLALINLVTGTHHCLNTNTLKVFVYIILFAHLLIFSFANFKF